MEAFEYRHIVGFEETNVVGNVYYANHILWQGRCREMFLREHAPDVLLQIDSGLALVTRRVECEYFRELVAFDEVTLRMRLVELSPYNMTLGFEYMVSLDDSQELVAKGEQELVCMSKSGAEYEPQPWPSSLKEALVPYLPHTSRAV